MSQTTRPTNSSLPYPILFPCVNATTVIACLKKLGVPEEFGGKAFACKWSSLQDTRSREEYQHRCSLIHFGRAVDSPNTSLHSNSPSAQSDTEKMDRKARALAHLLLVPACGNFDVGEVRSLWVDTPDGAFYYGGYRRLEVSEANALYSGQRWTDLPAEVRSFLLACLGYPLTLRARLLPQNQVYALRKKHSQDVSSLPQFAAVVAGHMVVPSYRFEFVDFHDDVAAKVYMKVFGVGKLDGMRIFNPKGAEVKVPATWIPKLGRIKSETEVEAKKEHCIDTLCSEIQYLSLALVSLYMYDDWYL
ncbi:hypothetical protein FRB90_003516 [Tulasnella sp. 427]|nr:hypothetical protein FRB90_003516 [Tulasnella sp. 427]